MHAIGHFINEENPAARVMYVTSETFTNELITAIQQDKRLEFRKRYRSVDILLIDDVQFISKSQATQEEFSTPSTRCTTRTSRSSSARTGRPRRSPSSRSACARASSGA